jgi:hypothetical protein
VTDVTDVFTVYLDGFADADIINYVLYGNPTPRELLLFSGLYGIPTDMTGTFVKGYNDSTGTKQLYRYVRWWCFTCRTTCLHGQLTWSVGRTGPAPPWASGQHCI